MKKDRATTLIKSGLDGNYVDFRKEVHNEFNERIGTMARELKSEIINRINGKKESLNEEDKYVIETKKGKKWWTGSDWSDVDTDAEWYDTEKKALEEIKKSKLKNCEPVSYEV